MPKITIIGRAHVFSNDEPVADAKLLATLDGTEYTEERFSDYISDGPAERRSSVVDAVAKAVKRGGILRFTYDGKSPWLTATVAYETKRPLTQPEADWLVEYTMAQWSDGIGENISQFSEDDYGYMIVCDTELYTPGGSYPSVAID
jgi:hypothetical protein